VCELDKRARVAQVYNLLRTARLNVLYYEESLSRWTSFIRGHDFIVAVSGGASPLAFLKRSSAPAGSQLWFYLTLVASVAGILKPILRLDKQVSLYSELVTHYRELFHELKCIADDIQSEKDFPPSMEKSFIRCRLREGDLQKKEPPPDRRKTKRLQAVVEKEYDINSLWFPD
jgi:hypothetical protein